MSLGMNTDGHSTGAQHSTAPHQGAPGTFPQLYGYPSAVQMDPQSYINNLLSENGMGNKVPGDSFFSSTDGSQHAENKSQNTLLKWGVGILAAAALWKIATRKKAESLLGNIATRIRNGFKRPPKAAAE